MLRLLLRLVVLALLLGVAVASALGIDGVTFGHGAVRHRRDESA